ncbi:MAG TPA: YciI family protein [Verrucomicrobiae bacterium]|nr:YciI family protein [Verrucomicrobiae bacterium]
MSAKNEYMFLFRGTEMRSTLSPEQMQEVACQMMAWFKRLADQGKVLAGSPLDDKGKVLSGKNGRVVADGPFAESKEAVGGYFLLQVDTMEEAVAIAKECPLLAHDGKVEVRQVLEECPFSGEAVPDIEPAAATA